MRKIELPSEKLAEELKGHLHNKRFTGAIFDKAQKTIQFPDDMDPSQWSSLRGAVEKWAEGEHLEVVESLKLQSHKPEAIQERVNAKGLEAEVKRRVDSLTPQMAEERYNYLSSKPITELSDAEYDERLELAQRSWGKAKVPKERKPTSG